MPVVVCGEFDLNDRLIRILRFETIGEAGSYFRDRKENGSLAGYWKDLEYVN